jgi:hypothetical protein
MKKIIPFVVVALAIAVNLQRAAAGFVDLPAEQEGQITGIFIAVLGLALDFAIGRFPWLEFFRQYQIAWATSLALLFTVGLENWLPTGSEYLSIQAVGLLIAAALYLLGRTVFRNRGVQEFG